MRSKKGWIAILLIAVLIGGGAYYVRQRRGARRQIQQVIADMSQMTMPVPRGNISRKIETSGTISGARQADLAFAASGRVQRVYVQLGDYVEEGQVLAQMESAQQELALLKAQNAYELARISGTPNALREAELDLKVAQTNLENTTIRAPFSGVITAVNIEEGEHASANSSVISLLDNSVFYADILVDELDMHLIQVGQEAVVQVDALGGRLLRGTVSQVGMIAQTSGGITTVPVTVRIEDGPADLRVGYSASVIIEVERAENVLKVPVEAVVRQGNRSFVTVLRDGERVPVEVVTGLSDGIEVEIVSGLEPTDEIVGFNFALYDRARSLLSGGMGSFGGIRIGGFGR